MPEFLRSRAPAEKSGSVMPRVTLGPSQSTGQTLLTQLRAQADASPAVTRLHALQRQADARSAPLQREVEDEELMQGKAMQRVEEEELLQGDTLQRQQTAATTNGGGLPAGLQQGIESLSGMSMADVRVHRNSDEPAEVGAHAFARGRDIHLASGQEQHLPHEAWHVVQQAQGRVQPTTQVNGVSVNDDASLEQEADRMGQNALRVPSAADQFI